MNYDIVSCFLHYFRCYAFIDLKWKPVIAICIDHIASRVSVRVSARALFLSPFYTFVRIKTQVKKMNAFQ